MYKLGIINVIAVSDLKKQVDLAKIGQNINVSYDPHKYGGRVAYLKTKTMYGKVSVFNSGKMISIGTKSVTQAKEDIHKAIEFLENVLNIRVFLETIDVVNIVASIDLGKNVDLEATALKISQTIYEPDQFPGLILRFSEPNRASILLFSSGKAIINGVKSERVARKVADQLQSLVKKFMMVKGRF
jgi:transcription initiation factor TFIID TATA-box-binding protein